MSRRKPYEQHEQDMAEILGGRVSKNSGRHWFDKSDGKSLDLQWDCKCTTAASFRLTSDIWRKIHLEAALEGRHPLLPVRFIDKYGKALADRVVCQEHLYLMIGGTKVLGDTLKTKRSHAIKRDDEDAEAFALEVNGSAMRLVVLDLGEFVEMREQWQS